MNFFAISIPLLIGGGILIWITQRTMRLSRLDQLQHISELAKMHKEICEKVSIMDNKYIELKDLANKIGNDELVYESGKLLEENAQLKRKLMSFEAAAIGPSLKPSSSLKKQSWAIGLNSTHKCNFSSIYERLICIKIGRLEQGVAKWGISIWIIGNAGKLKPFGWQAINKLI